MNQMNESPPGESDDAVELAWVDVKHVVADLRDYWVGGSEQKWLEHAWGVLAAEGLTSYTTEVGRMRCLVRAVTLWAICRTFCVQISNGAHPDDWRYEIEGASTIGDDADLDPFVLGLLAAHDDDQFDDEWHDMSMGEVVVALVRREHGAVAGALRRRVGDNGLFFELKATARVATVDDDDSEAPDDAYVGAGVGFTADDGVALDWITNGMPL